jgi:hypothetical protein
MAQARVELICVNTGLGELYSERISRRHQTVDTGFFSFIYFIQKLLQLFFLFFSSSSYLARATSS